MGYNSHKKPMKKLFLSICACLLTCCMAFAGSEIIAERTQIGGLYYTLTHDTYPSLNIDMRNAVVLPKVADGAAGNSDYVSGVITIPATVSYGGDTYTVTAIEHHAFYGCSNLQQVVFASDDITINRYAFSHCPYLAKLSFASSTVTLVGEYIFSDNGRLATVEFTQYDATQCNFSSAVGAFMNCTGLQLIVLPRTVEALPDHFFLNCSALEEVHFGMPYQATRSIRNFGNEVFANCTNLQKVYLHGWSGIAPTITATSFSNMPSTAKFIMPCTYSSVITGAGGYWANVTIEEEWDNEFRVVSADETMGSVVIVKAPDCEDMTATIAAYPNENYSFYQWSDGNQQNPRMWLDGEINTNTSIHLSALFIANDCATNGKFPYLFSIENADESKGSVSITKAPDCDDASATIVAYPYAGYTFAGWTDANHGNVLYSVQATVNIPAVTENMHLVANWEEADCATNGVFPYKLNTSVNMPEAGTIEVQKAPDCDDASAQIAAYPYAGYAFEAWYDLDNSVVYSYQAVTTIANVDRDMNLQASFVVADCATNGVFPYQFHVVSSDKVTGTVEVTKAPDCDNPSARVYARANTASGYVFMTWSDGETENPRSWSEVTEDVNISALFTEGEHGCDKDGIFPYIFSVVADNEAFGTVEVKIPTCDDPSARATARPNAGYEFVIWSDGTTVNPRSWNAVNQDVNISAIFKEKDHSCETDGVLGYMFKIEPNDYNMGTTMMSRIPDCDDPSTDIEARAKEGYEFVRWSDGDNHASRTIEVTGDIYLQAIFQDPTNPIEGIEEVGMQQSAMSAQKVLRDGVLYIICPDGKTYNAQGAEVR